MVTRGGGGGGHSHGACTCAPETSVKVLVKRPKQEVAFKTGQNDAREFKGYTS